MSDLIDRQKAIDAIFEAFSTGDEGADRYIAEKILANVPSAQPEIIRCKDCKFWEKAWAYDFDTNLHYCPLVDGGRRDDFYCADAEERRTDE